jgi:hypothetical protein
MSLLQLMQEKFQNMKIFQKFQKYQTSFKNSRTFFVSKPLDLHLVMKKFYYDLKNYKNYMFFRLMIMYCNKLDQSCNIFISYLCLIIT